MILDILKSSKVAEKNFLLFLQKSKQKISSRGKEDHEKQKKIDERILYFNLKFNFLL